MRLLAFLSGLIVFWAPRLSAQIDSHYWTHQYGAQGLLLNGAVIASTQGETALFYNPGAVGIDQSSGFELSFITPTYSYLRTDNLLGDRSSLEDTGFDFAPGFLGITFKPSSSKKWTMGVTTFQRFKTDISFDERVLETINDDLLFRGDLDFERRISEHWVGVNLAHNVSKSLGIGITQFATFHSQSTRFNLKKEILRTDSPTDLFQSWRREFSYDLSDQASFVTKAGLSWHGQIVKVGLTLTSPTYGALYERASYVLEDHRVNVLNDDQNTTVSNRKSNLPLTRRSPASVGLGFEFSLVNSVVSLSGEYFGRVGSYTTLIDEDDPFDSRANGDLPTRVEILEGNESVMNFAIGYQTRLNETTSFILGFRTDLDPTNSVIINEFPEYLGTVGDVYHLSGGGMIQKDKNQFSLGLDIGYGSKSGGQQLASFSNVDQASLFEVQGDESVSSRFFSVMIFCTYDFIYSSLHTEDEQ